MADHRDAAYWAAVRSDADKLALTPAVRDRLHTLLAPMRDALTEKAKRAA